MLWCGPRPVPFRCRAKGPGLQEGGERTREETTIKKLIAAAAALAFLLSLGLGCEKTRPADEPAGAEPAAAETEPAEAEPATAEPAETEPAAAGKAAEALDTFITEKKDRLEAIKREMDGVGAKLTPERQRALGMKYMEKMGPAMQRLMKLNAEHPELFSDPKVVEAMTKVKN